MKELNHICAARLPAIALPALAVLRCRSGIQAIPHGESIWLHWNTADDDILREVLPIPGVELYYQNDGHWYRFGQRLPMTAPPSEPVQRLDRLLVPERLVVEEPTPTPLEPVRLALVRDGRPRQPAALVCSVAALHAWAITATSRELAALQAARHDQRIVLMGSKLPLLADGERFWGQRVLAPLGYRVEPALPETALADVLGLRGGEIALIGHGGIDIIAEDAFGSLTRAAVRLAHAEVRP